MAERGAKGVTAAGDGRRILIVDLSEAEFQRLLSAISATLEAASKDVEPAKGKHAVPRSRIWRAPAIAAAVERMIAERLTIDAMAERLETEFGPDQVPARSSIGRYVRDRRLGRLPT